MKSFDRIYEEVKAEQMPFDSWEMLPKESTEAFAAFVVYRDLGFNRSVKKAIESVKDNSYLVCAYSQSYASWRKWAADYRWKERAADYDRYIEQMKQNEHRKTIEAQAEKHREVTGKMLDVVNKKLDTMKPEDLPISGVVDWVQTAVKADREAWQSANADCLGVSASRNSTPKQGEFNFVSDFQGL